jgi:hypothetical protein
MIPYVLSVALLAGFAPAERMTLDWASFPVERESFRVAERGQYSTSGAFAGVGMMYVSLTRKTIQFKGLARIELPHLGQGPTTKYEFWFETFAIESIIPLAAEEYAFEAVREGPFPRRLTGKVRISVPTPGLPVGKVEDFVAQEHGTAIQGVMNRFSLVSTPAAKALLKKYDDVFFGGHYAALEPAK